MHNTNKEDDKKEEKDSFVLGAVHTEAQKQAGVEWCRDIIDKFEAGSSRDVYDILTGNKSWIYQNNNTI